VVARIAHLPGVAGAACSSGNPLGAGDYNNTLYLPDGRQVNAGAEPIDFGFFELYGVKLLAGRLPSPTHGDDAYVSPAGVRERPHNPRNVTINAALARAMGFARPREAIGKTFRGQYAIAPATFETQTVTGVVADTQFDLTQGPPKPSVYPVWPQSSSVLSVKIRGDRIPETLAAIDRLWKEAGDPRPISRRFTNEYLNTVYASTLRQGWLIEGLAAVAIFIASLGLFGLAAFTTEQRTKEIGVRRAMGASARDILRLMLWSFSRPVLWANLIAWPLGWWAMKSWLDGFSAHVALSPWLFVAAGSAALLIALATVLAHTLRVASAKPVGALRYE
jgi:putative ABC transport system permease protein